MNSLTKFFIALFVFVLLSFIVKAQRAVGNGTPVISGGGEVSRQELRDSVSNKVTDTELINSLSGKVSVSQLADSVAIRVRMSVMEDSLAAIRGDIPNVSESNPFLTYAFVWGNLDAQVYTEAQKKTIRRQNYLYFEEIINTAKATNKCLDFPGNTLQIHLLPNDEIEISDKEIVCLVGVDKKSKIEIYPKALIRGNPAYVFEMKDGGSLDIKNIHFLGSNNFARAECYAGVLRLAGDYTKIKIQDTTQIRTGFWNASLIGAKVGIKHSSANNVARTYTISSYDAGTRIITLTGNIDFSVNADYADSGTLLAFHWNTDEVHPDTVSRYGRFFRIEETSSSHHFIYGTIGESNFSKQAYLKLRNCRIERFETGIYVAGGWLDYHFDDSYFQGDVIAITKYIGGYGYGNPSTIYMNRCELAYSGKQLVANAVKPYGSQNGNLLFGSGAYNHPNTRVVVKDCYIHDNYTGAFRQFSDGDEKPSPEWFASYFINTTFRNNAEYHILASNTHRTVIQNCTFDNGNVHLCYSTDFENSLLLNSYVNLYSYGNAQPKPNADTVQLRINFNHVKFHKYSTFNNGWSNSRSKRTVINFNNCDFELSIITVYYNQKITTGNYCTVNINNAWLFNRNSNITHPDILNHTTKGTQVQGFLYYGDMVKLYANNIRYDTLRNSIPLIPTHRYNYISGKISNSILLGVDGQYAQYGSSNALEFENVEYPYTFYRVPLGYNFKSGVDKTTSVTITNNIVREWNYPNSIWLTSSASNYYITNSDSLKYIFWGTNTITGVNDLRKNNWPGFSGTITLIADTSFCMTTGGNIRIDTPVCFQKGDVIKLKHNPFDVAVTGTIVRDSILANGTTVFFGNALGASQRSFKRGNCKIYVNNTLVGTDDYNEIVSNSTVKGHVQYFSNMFYLRFAVPPANGSYVIVERRYCTQGMWKIE